MTMTMPIPWRQRIVSLFFVGSCLFLHLWVDAGTGSQSQQQQQQQQQKIELLRTKAYTVGEDSPEYVETWQQILSLDPHNLEAHVMLGWKLIMTGHGGTSAASAGGGPASAAGTWQEYGIQLLEDSFREDKVSPTIDFNFPQTMIIAATIGRYRSQRKEYIKGKYFTQLAWELSKKFNGPHGDACIQMQLASMFDYFPVSTTQADSALEALNFYADDILSSSQPDTSTPTSPLLNEDQLSANMPGAANDPYVHCMLSLFSLSFYYRADVASTARRHYEMAVRGWPALAHFVAPHVQRYEQQQQQQQNNGLLTCQQNRKIKLGVIAGVLSEGHSVTEDFGGVLQRLDRDVFHVTYIYLHETGSPKIANFTKVHSTDRQLVWQKEYTDQGRGAWLVRWGHEVAKMELDIILYLDLTMSTYARRMGMMRLAPVQLNTHGHPVTSGHDPSIINYFVSWAEAELPLEQAQTHYTEQLQLIPLGKLHQYYLPRTLPGQRSRMDGQSFGHLTRADFGLPPDNTTLYLCMQKPFKMHPEFDPLVCGVLQNDESGYVVLHKEENQANHVVFLQRLQRAGCDMNRVQFMDAQPHHRLLALYRLSTVVLDS